jgi:polysaccharide pyruvyl transferase WcaK-like protein
MLFVTSLKEQGKSSSHIGGWLYRIMGSGTLKSIDARLRMGSSSKEPRCQLRIGLLTPYGGTNLGDAAIQTAAIDGLRRWLPTAELWGITLNPVETAKRHGIQAFPITGLLVQFYSETLFEPIRGLGVQFITKYGLEGNIRNQDIERSRPQGHIGIRQRLKQIPLLGEVLKFLASFLRKGYVVIYELRHLRTSFHFVKKLDMVIVSGGGQLDESWGRAWGHPYALFRWAVLARLARKQFVVISVGVGDLTTRLGTFFARTALSLAAYRSYRDLVSKRLLEDWTFTRNDAHVPDLAFGLHVPIKDSLSLHRSPAPVVGISPMAFGRYGSWPKSYLDAYTKYLLCLAELTAFLIERGYRVVFFKSSGIDPDAIEDLQIRIVQRCSVGVLNTIGVPTVETLQELLQEVKKMDFVVASRLHSVILAHILGKPVLAISYDRKVGTHMHDVGQGQYVLDLTRINSIDLVSCFQDLVGEAETIRGIVRSHVLRFQESVDKQFEHLSKLLETVNNRKGNQ